ncbi:MAG: hypothetical protein ACK5RQ_01370, partial [Bacteroidota bacterium]
CILAAGLSFANHVSRYKTTNFTSEGESAAIDVWKSFPAQFSDKLFSGSHLEHIIFTPFSLIIGVLVIPVLC